MMYSDASSDDDDVSSSASDQSTKRQRDAFGETLEAYRRKEGQKQLRFQAGGLVRCPECLSRDPKKSLSALVQHARGLAESHDPKKLPGQHRALAAYVLLDLLKIRENAPPREVEGACQSWMASKKEPINSSGQLGAVGGQTSLPSGFRDDGSRPSKIVRLFAPQQLQGLDTLELMWPPCVIVRETQSRSRCGDDPKRGQDLILDWMRSFANFDTLDNMRIRPGYTSAGFTGEYLLRFKNTSEGFLEAIHLDLLLRAQSGKVDGKSGEVALEGKLALAKDCHRGWDLKKNGLSIRKFRASVLAPVQHSEAKLKQILHENGQASAENAELSSALMDSTQELCALSDKAEERMNHFKEMVEKLNAELISNKRLKEEHDRENQQKFEQQQARISELHTQYRDMLQSYDVLQGKTEEMVQAMQQMKLQQTELEIEREREFDQAVRELDLKHQREKKALWQRHEGERKASQLKHKVKLEEAEHATPDALKAAKEAQAWELEKARRDREHKMQTERIVKLVIAEMENDHKAREEKLKREFEQKIEETAGDDMSFVGPLQSLYMKVNDKVQDVLNYAKECDVQTHWAFGKDPNEVYQPSKVLIHNVGDLSSDPEFDRCLWAFCLAKHGLPEDLEKGGIVDLRLKNDLDAAEDLFMDERSLLQSDYIENPNFYPFKTVAETDNAAASLADTDVGMVPLIEKYGRAIAEAVRKVKRELLHVNASGDYCVRRFWNVEENCDATPLEVLKAIDKRGEELLQIVERGEMVRPRTRPNTRASTRQSNGSSQRRRPLPVLA